MRTSLKVLTPVLALGLAALAGCGSDSEDPASGADGQPEAYGSCPITGNEDARGSFPLDTLESGRILVKADLPSPGWYNGDTIEAIDSGFDFCLLANIANRAGIDDIVLQNTSFDGLVAGKAGDFDMSLNQITITAEREKVFDFSDPYFQSTAGILVKEGSDLTEDGLADASLGVKQGTVGQTLVTEVVQPAQDPSVFPGDPELNAAVASDRVDAGIQDLSIVLGAATNSGGSLEVVGQIETDEAYGIMLPKGSANLDPINQILAELKSDGTLDELSEKYLTDAYGVDPASIPVWQVG